MAELEINKIDVLDQSYERVIQDLNKWRRELEIKLDHMYNDVLYDMNSTYNFVHYFASLTNALLIEQENQLLTAQTNEQIDLIQERINEILFEIEYLKCKLHFLLSFDLNCKQIHLIGQIKINYNNDIIKSMSTSLSDPIVRKNYNSSENNYRFLISRIDGIELEKHSISNIILTLSNNELLNECILTLNAFDYDSFRYLFRLFWNFYSNLYEIRLLLSEFDRLTIENQLFDYKNRFQLKQIKFYSNLCPKSNENILFIHGKQRCLIQNLIEEIYFNLKCQINQQNILFYNPNSLSLKDINDIINNNIDYGGLIWYETNSNIIQREMIISNIYAGVIIGINATRIDQIKEETGAYVYIAGEASDLKRTVVIKGTCEQVKQAYCYIENLIEKYKNNKFSIKQERLNGKLKWK